MPSYFAVTVKDQSSSDESWETLPGKEEQEPEVQSDSSGVEEEHNEFSFQAGYVFQFQTLNCASHKYLTVHYASKDTKFGI